MASIDVSDKVRTPLGDVGHVIGIRSDNTCRLILEAGGGYSNFDMDELEFICKSGEDDLEEAKCPDCGYSSSKLNKGMACPKCAKGDMGGGKKDLSSVPKLVDDLISGDLALSDIIETASTDQSDSSNNSLSVKDLLKKQF